MARGLAVACLAAVVLWAGPLRAAPTVPVDWAVALRIAEVEIGSAGVTITGNDLAFLDAGTGEARLRLVLFDAARRFGASLAGGRPVTLRMEVRDLFGATGFRRDLYALELRYALADAGGAVLARSDWREVERPVLLLGSAEESMADAVAQDLAAWARDLGCVPGMACGPVPDVSPDAVSPDAVSRVAPEESAPPRPRPGGSAAEALAAPPASEGPEDGPDPVDAVAGFFTRLFEDPAPDAPGPAEPVEANPDEASPDEADLTVSPDAPATSAPPRPRPAAAPSAAPAQPSLAQARWIGSTPAVPTSSDRPGLWVASDMIAEAMAGWVSDESTGATVEARLVPLPEGRIARAEMSAGAMRALGLVPGQHANLSVYLPR